MLRLDYHQQALRAVLSWDPDDVAAGWPDVVRRMLVDRVERTTLDSATSMSLPWWSFVAIRGQLLEILTSYRLKLGQGFVVSDKAKELLQRSTRAATGYETAIGASSVPEADLKDRLAQVGFARPLTAQQLRNVGRMARLPAAATFSVPGAGKTTEALAFFFYRARENERLLVVAPKNAFAAWDEQLAECMPHLAETVVRLKGAGKVEKLLASNPRFMIVSYHTLANNADLISAHLAEHSAFVFLDESHRVKSGADKQIARAALSLSHLPVGKLVMSGTPMPQSHKDLVPQFSFLFPEIETDEDHVVDHLRPIFVRTTKTELGLPPVSVDIARLPMAPLQRELYRLMKFEAAREARTALSIQGTQRFRSLGRSITRLLQFVSNPALLGGALGAAHPELLKGVIREGDGPKLQYVFDRARKLASEGKKVLIWSSYVKNVEYIAQRLSDLGAVFIHGGTEASDDEENTESREARIRQFHDDPNVKVLVANPAAASEGISLHKVCHHAIYLDRTFNVAHYLQSIDRIHRLGLAPDLVTTVEIVECLGTIDETVMERLTTKIDAMGNALQDPDLVVDPVEMDLDDADEYSAGLSEADIAAILKHLDEEQL